MERRTLIKMLGAVPLAGAAAARAAREVPLPALGSALALPDVDLFDGGRFKASEARGHVVLVYWWASWCPFCAVQTPYIQKLWDAQRTRGLKVLGLSIDRRVEDARRYIAQRGYSFPTGHNTPEVERVLPKPSKGLPVTCVLGKDGRVLMAEAGQLFPEDIEDVARFL